MSTMSSLFARIIQFIINLFLYGSKKGIRPWDKCKYSTNWSGSNAQMRFMNMLSPHMSKDKFKEYKKFILNRDCDTVNLILCNKSDGECAGYSIYGSGKPSATSAVDKNFAEIMENRIKDLYSSGLGIVLWLMTDDSSDWNKELLKNVDKYISDIDKLGWFDYASIVVTGLEIDEYYSATECSQLSNALRKKYKGKIGIHQCSDKYNYAAFGDIFFYQADPSKSNSHITSQIQKIKSATGKPVIGFELDRHENRDKCNAAFAGGAVGVGNW